MANAVMFLAVISTAFMITTATGRELLEYPDASEHTMKDIMHSVEAGGKGVADSVDRLTETMAGCFAGSARLERELDALRTEVPAMDTIATRTAKSLYKFRFKV